MFTVGEEEEGGVASTLGDDIMLANEISFQLRKLSSEV